MEIRQKRLTWSPSLLLPPIKGGSRVEQNLQAAWAYNEIAQLIKETWLGNEIRAADFLVQIRKYGPGLSIGETARSVEVLVKMLRGDFGLPGQGEFINQMSQGEREIYLRYSFLEETEKTAIEEAVLRVFEIISRRTSGVVPSSPATAPEAPPVTPETPPVTPETPPVPRMSGAALEEGPIVEPPPVRGPGGPRNGGGIGGAGGLLGGVTFCFGLILPLLELPVQEQIRNRIDQMRREGTTSFEMGGQQYIFVPEGMI